MVVSRPSVTWPNRLYVGGRPAPFAPVITKNWLPPEFGWPVFAIASEPIWYSPASGGSSGIVYPGPPCPVPSGSPHCTTNPGMIRWQIVSSK